MKSVRQVSMVEREVALTERVTERPKKLKPLDRCQFNCGKQGGETWGAKCTYPILNIISTLEISTRGLSVH